MTEQSDHGAGPGGPPMIQFLSAQGKGYTEHDQARADLAEATRRLITLLVDTDAGTGVLGDVTALVDRAASKLAAQPIGRHYHGAPTAPRHETKGLSFAEFSPVVGPLNPLSPPIQMEVEPDLVRGRVTYTSAFEGPPGHVHGWFIAAGFDEVLGFAQGLSGQSGMTGRLEGKYRSPTPLNTAVVYEAWLESAHGRKITCKATLSVGARLCAEATALFVAASAEQWAALAAMRAAASEPREGAE